MMTSHSSRRGFILPVTLIMMAIVTITVSGIAGFVSHAARMTRIHLAQTRCRLAAQAAIEEAKSRIQKGFSKYVGTSDSTAVKIDPRQGEVYNWFDTVSADRRTIGISDAKRKAVTLTDPADGINDCQVNVAIGMYVDHASGSSYAAVPIVATASYTYPDGLTVTSTIQERVAFGTGQSPVFDYAYFVNNYGWMNGSSIAINGDMRANGNVSLSGSTVNGYIYAAENDELNVDGTISLSSSPQIQSQSSYRSKASTRARADLDDYDTSGAYDAPKTGGTIVRPTYDSDGNVKSGTVGSSSGKPIVNEYSDSLPMPFVSDLDSYAEYAAEYNGGEGGSLSYPGYSYTDSAGTSHSVASGSVNTRFSGVGPSGDENLADKGALVLIGTKANPITIDGPVVVDSDVIIKGYVQGQGTIYSGRNVHIIGDIMYVNEPTWNHPDADDEAVEESNATKDMLGLVAKGNVIIGDSSSSSWHDTVDTYIDSGNRNSVVNAYECDEDDANIGYPTDFDGDYTATEKVTGLSSTLAESAPGGYDSSTGQFGKVRTGTETYTTTETRQVKKTEGKGRNKKTYTVTEEVQVTKQRTVTQTEYNRHYYETVCDDKILSSLKDSVGIKQIDAILYNNHGVFGTPGRSGYSFNLNGSLVCRDEAMIFSGNGINFNWDMRLRSKNSNKVTSSLSLPVGPQDPYTVEWMEVPDNMNAAYKAAQAEANK